MKLFVSLVLALASWLVAGAAAAHAIGISKGAYVLEGNVVRAEITFARGEMLGVVPSLDPDRDGTIRPEDVSAAKAALAKAVAGGVIVRGNGEVCPAALDDARLTEEDGIALLAHYDCPMPPVRLEIQVKLLGELSHGHRHIVHVVLGTITIDEVAYRGHETVDALAPSDAAQGNGKRRLGAAGFLRMGVEHILTGYDHLVFLLGLVIVGGRLRSLLAVVTAFTLAHSITLGMAALGVWVPPSRLIEPLIALSIAYVGIENFFVKSAEKRWRITFPFGLVHGFGFASALREIELPHEQVPTALVFFNLGVEVGQLAVMAPLLPLIYFLRKKTPFVPRGVEAVSGAVALAGLFWFVDRIVHG
jgi:hydrogenase/urease accessory protein HupE